MTTTNSNSNNQKNTNNTATTSSFRFDPSDLAKVANALCRCRSCFGSRKKWMLIKHYKPWWCWCLKTPTRGILFIWAQCQTWWNNAICTGWNKQHYAATASKNVFQGNLKSPFLAFSMKFSFRFLHEPKAPSVSWLDQVILFTEAVIFAWGWYSDYPP